MFTLAGLGLLQSGHCDDSPTVVTTQSAVDHHTVSTIAAAVTAPTSADHHHDHLDTPDRPAVTDACRPLTITVAAVPTGAAMRTAPSLRAVTVVAAFRLPLPSGRIVPRVALDALGVSRT